MNSFWMWLVSFFSKSTVVVEGVKPLITEGGEIIDDVIKIIKDLKANDLVSVVNNGQELLKDVEVFVADLTKVINDLKSKQARGDSHETI